MIPTLALGGLGRAGGDAAGVVGAPPSAPADAYGGNVVSMLHFDGVGGAFTDAKGLIWTPNGQANVSALASKFGGASGQFDGAGDWIQTPATPFAFGAKDFCVEGWVNWSNYSSSGASQALMGQLNAAGAIGSIALQITGTHKILGVCFNAAAGTFGLCISAASVAQGVWYHLAYTRSGNVFRLFINGVLDGTITEAGTVNPSADVMSIGRTGAYNDAYMNGFLDDMRFTIGVPRYTANFTPPAEAYPDPADLLFGSVISQLRFDGVDGATFFTDDKSSVLWAANGNAQMDNAQSRSGGTSILFDGTGDWIDSPDSTIWTLGTGDFCVECWFRANSLAGLPMYLCGQANGPGTAQILVLHIDAASKLAAYCYTDPTMIGYCTGTTTITTGVWNHAAYVRYGTTFSLYLNGVLQATATSALALPDVAAKMAIGRLGEYTPGTHFNGWIDDFRVTKGVARYNANFIPPGQFPALPAVLVVDDPLDPYNANVVSYLNFDGVDGSTDFVDRRGLFWTPVGNAQIDTAFRKFGSGSGLFDGTGDYITTPAIPAFTLGTQDFTIELYVKFNALTVYGWLAGQCDAIGSAVGLNFRFEKDTADKIHAGVYIGGVEVGCTGAVAVAANIWYHLAFTRQGSNFRLFKNGVQEGTTAINAGSIPASPFALSIAALGEYTSGRLNGAIDMFRMTLGVARYTANFTPPVLSAPDLISQLDFDGVNGSTVFTDAKGLAWTANGNARIDTSQSKYGGSSLYLDGTGDWIDTPDSPVWSQASDFCIEFWMRIETLAAGAKYICGQALTDESQQGLVIHISATNVLSCYGYTGGVVYGDCTGGAVAINTWYHVAYTRTGNVFRSFLDGVQQATVTEATVRPDMTTKFSIGKLGERAAAGAQFNGWIDDWRATIGFSRYTANFTPPLAFGAADPLFANVVCLLHGDGANNSTVFNDVKGNVWTANGGAKLDTSQSKFGGSSMYFDGTAANCIDTSDDPKWAMGSSDFCVETWIRFATSTGQCVFCGQSDASALDGSVTGQRDGNVGAPHIIFNALAVGGTTIGQIQSTVTIAGATWYHLAYTRIGSTFNLYVDGVSQGTATSALAINDAAQPMAVGRLGLLAAATMNGWMDDFRITKGNGRYTANFTPPTVQHPDF